MCVEHQRDTRYSYLFYILVGIYLVEACVKIFGIMCPLCRVRQLQSDQTSSYLYIKGLYKIMSNWEYWQLLVPFLIWGKHLDTVWLAAYGGMAELIVETRLSRMRIDCKYLLAMLHYSPDINPCLINLSIVNIVGGYDWDTQVR